MRLEKDDQYGYNRYLDSLHLKAGEVFSLQSEAEFKSKDELSIEIVKNAILNNADNDFISAITGLSIDKTQALRNEKEN